MASSNEPEDDIQNDSNVFTTNEKGAIALTTSGVGTRMMEENKRGASLVVLSTQLVGPRGQSVLSQFTNKPAKPAVVHGRHHYATQSGRSSHITMDRLTELMNDVLIEAETLNTIEDYNGQIIDLLILMFSTGDILDGRGERQIFIWMMTNFISYCPDLVIALLPLIPEYTCWRTLGSLYYQIKQESLTSRVLDNNDLATTYARILNTIIDLWADQLCKDNEALRKYNARQEAKQRRTTTTLTSTTTSNAMNITDDRKDDEGDGDVTATETDTDEKMNVPSSNVASSSTTATTATKKTPKPKRNGPPLSLAGKWAPTIGKAVDRACFLGQELSRALYLRLPDNVRYLPKGSKVSAENSSSSSSTVTTTTTTNTSVLQEVTGSEKIPEEILAMLKAQANTSSGPSSSTVPPSKPAFSYASIATQGAKDLKANIKAYNEAKAKAESDREQELEKERKLKESNESTRKEVKMENKQKKRRVNNPNRLLLQSETENAAEKTYRKVLGELRESLQVIERFMANDRWDEIQPTSIASLANNKYSAALLNRVGSVKMWNRDAGAYEFAHHGVDLTKIVSVHGDDARRTDNPKRIYLSKAIRDAANASLSVAVPEGITPEEFEKLRSSQIKGARLQPHQLVEKVMQSGPVGSSKVPKPKTNVRGAPRYDDDTYDSTATVNDIPQLPKGDVLIEAMWADLIRSMKAKGGFTKPIVPLVDVSGSMAGLPMQVAIALGIVIASINPEKLPWFGKVITFDSNPSWHDISNLLPNSQNTDGSFYATVKSMQGMPWGGSTHFGKALRLILDVMKAAELPPEFAPSTLFVFSDMQFDSAADKENQIIGTTIDGVEPYVTRSPFSLAGEDMMAAFDQAGYPRPTIVFWNLRANGVPTFQADANTPGVIMVSGFSTEIMRQICDEGVEAAVQSFDALKTSEITDEVNDDENEGNEISTNGNTGAAIAPKVKLTPWEFLQKSLTNERYNKVRQCLGGSTSSTSSTATTTTSNTGTVSSSVLDISRLVNLESLMKIQKRFTPK